MTATTNALATFKTPHLDDTARAHLIEALSAHIDGKRVQLAVTYHKVTKSKPRQAGVDYKPRLAHGPEVIEGAVKKVAKGKNGWYVLLDATVTRRPLTAEGKVDKTRLGWTAIKGEGMDALLGAEIEDTGLPAAQ